VSDSGTVGEVTETSRTADTDAVVVSRRVALGAGVCAALAFVSACGRSEPSTNGAAGPGAAATSGNVTSGTVNGDVRLLVRAIAGEEALGAFCAAAARRFREDRPLLVGLVQRQRLHVKRFRETLTDLTPPVNHRTPRLPRNAKDLPSDLGALALDARNARSGDCLAATSGLLAELFASVAASHAVTVQIIDPRVATTAVSVPDSVISPDALQPCLAAEHAALFGYSLLGGVLSAAVSGAPSAKAAVASYQAHRDRRDALTELIVAAGGKPVVAEAAYDVPFPVAGVPSARRLARDLESRCATVYARATAATTAESRLMVSGTLLDCAVRGARWGTAPAAFPGLEAT
jgi:uncharacterized protein DUF4439